MSPKRRGSEKSSALALQRYANSLSLRSIDNDQNKKTHIYEQHKDTFFHFHLQCFEKLLLGGMLKLTIAQYCSQKKATIECRSNGAALYYSDLLEFQEVHAKSCQINLKSYQETSSVNLLPAKNSSSRLYSDMIALVRLQE